MCSFVNRIIVIAEFGRCGLFTHLRHCLVQFCLSIFVLICAESKGSKMVKKGSTRSKMLKKGSMRSKMSKKGSMRSKMEKNEVVRR